MWIQVRSMDGHKNVRIDDLSKLTKIEDLRKKLVTHFNADPERQHLFFRGKQLVDGRTLFDYDVGLNEIVQILIKAVASEKTSPRTSPKKKENGVADKEISDVTNGSQESSDSGFETGDTDTLYKVGEKVDARDLKIGAWFEARIRKIVSPTPQQNGNCDSPSSSHLPNYLYRVAFDGYPDEENLEEKDIRPRARHKRSWEDINVGDTLMLNYNCDEPKQRGYWYDGCVTRKHVTDKETKKLFCKLLLGTILDPIEDCEIKFLDEIFEIEPPKTPGMELKNDEGEKKTPECPYCNDKPSRRKCYYCHCRICDSKEDAENTLLCDECDNAYHMQCLDPPITSLPLDEQWLKEQIAQLRQKNKLLNKENEEIRAKLLKSEEEHFALTNKFTTADEGSVVKLRDAYRHMQHNLRAAAVREHKKLYGDISLSLADQSMVAYNNAKVFLFTELKSITDRSLYQLQMPENGPHNHKLSQNYLLLIRSLHKDHKLSEDVRSEIEKVLTEEYRVITSQAPRGIPESIKEYYAALAKFSWDCVARAIPLVMSTDYNEFDKEMHEAREAGDDDDDINHERKEISYIYPVLLTSSNWPREVALKGKVVLKAR